MKKELFTFVVALLVFPTICLSQTSPDGTTIVAPTNNTVTDASGNIWGFAGSDPSFPLDFYVTANGQMIQAQGYSAGTFWSMSELLILNNGQLYATENNYGGGAYQWNGVTFNQIPSLPSGGGASQTSPDGTTIVAPTNNTVTDASGNVWGFAGSDPAFPLDFDVTANGQMIQAQGYPAGTFWSMSELLILNNGQLYATDNNYGGGAYQWNGATFNQIPSLPSGGASPTVVQAPPPVRISPVALTCSVSFTAIHSGDTVVGYVHSTNADQNVTYPSSVSDNAGNTYTLVPAIQWTPYPESIGMWYKTNVTGNPTTFTFNYPSVSHCDVGIVEYSGATSVSPVVGPVANASVPDPSIQITPTASSLIWAFGAPNTSCPFQSSKEPNGSTSGIETPGYTDLVDDCAVHGFAIWGSNSTVAAGAMQRLQWNNETYYNANVCGDGTHTTTGCSTIMMAAAIH